ncbi:probable serine/threonine-protein kinase nek1 [Daphnia pulicaria]|uniref:probable serine/threonine-protein kinase nek1 n=1 Tax=Daphnia pulicaria TaxID=35523 RepID=UPI001EEC4850|nr:probable serine/threonine-protein kinase nek1 [Daphnia pulicaria]
MAKHSKSKRSRKSSSSSSSDSDSSSSSASSSKSFSSTFSDIIKLKSKRFEVSKRKSSVLANWIVKGIGEKNLKAAREAYRPDVKRDKKASVSASELFTNPKLDETFYAALKSTKNSNASMPNIDQLEKVYRKQTDVVLDMAKPLLFLLERKSKRSDKDTKALKTLSLLWAHLFREITHSRRLNILTQTHPNHIGLLSRAAEKLPVGGEDLFGTEFVNELISQVKTASLMNSSAAGPSATSTPGKRKRSPPPLQDSRKDRSNYSFDRGNNNGYRGRKKGRDNNNNSGNFNNNDSSFNKK